MAEESAVVAAAPTEVEVPAEDTGASGEQPEVIDWSARLKEDPTLAEYVRKEADRLRQRDRDRERRAQRKQLAQEVDTAPDESTKAQKASELAKLVATEKDPDDEADAVFTQKARVADAAISRLRHTDEYAELWTRTGKAEMDRRWHQDPEEFADWIWEQVTEIRAEKRAKAKAGPMTEAAAQDLANQRLRNLPTPVTGVGGPSVGGMSLERLLSLSPSESYAWKKAHKSEYDQLVAALAAAG